MLNNAVKYGVIGGLLVVIYLFGFYYMGKQFYLNPAVQWSSMVIYIGCMWMAAQAQKKAMGGKIPFMEVLRPAFLAFVIINFIFYLFTYSLYLYDAELLKILTEKKIAFITQQLDAGAGDQANRLREELQYLQRDGMSLTINAVFLQMALGSIGGFGIAAAIAYITKTE